MAAPRYYTTMPWAMRSALQQAQPSANSSASSDSGDSTITGTSIGFDTPAGSTNGDDAAAQYPNTAALIEQLAAAHIAQRELEEQVENLQRNANQRLADVQRESKKRFEELREEFSQCRAREDAVQVVFVQNYEKEQALARKMRELEEKETELKEEQERLETEKKELEEGKASLEMMRAALNDTTAVPRGEATNAQEDKKITNSSKFDKYDLDVSFDTMNDAEIQLLRRHDYYMGWVHATQIAGQEEAVSQGLITASMVPHFSDVNHPKNAYCAGANAGALFTWAALSQLHKPEWSIRLDDRRFSAKSLAIPRLQQDKPFWKGFAGGEAAVRKVFWGRMARSDAHVSGDDNAE